MKRRNKFSWNWRQKEGSVKLKPWGFLELYILTTSKVISGWVPTCDSAHLWRLYNTALPENQAAGTMTWYASDTLSWHWANQSLPYHNNAEPVKYHFYKWLVWLDQYPISPHLDTHYYLTRWDSRMSRASVSRFRRTGNPNLMGSNPGPIKPMTLILTLVVS